MVIDLGQVVSWLTALGFVGGVFFGLFRLLARLDKLETQMAHRKEDNKEIFTALLACLDGLHQLGANGNVTTALASLEKYIVGSR